MIAMLRMSLRTAAVSLFFTCSPCSINKNPKTGSRGRHATLAHCDHHITQGPRRSRRATAFGRTASGDGHGKVGEPGPAPAPNRRAHRARCGRRTQIDEVPDRDVDGTHAGPVDHRAEHRAVLRMPLGEPSGPWRRRANPCVPKAPAFGDPIVGRSSTTPKWLARPKPRRHGDAVGVAQQHVSDGHVPHAARIPPASPGTRGDRGCRKMKRSRPLRRLLHDLQSGKGSAPRCSPGTAGARATPHRRPGRAESSDCGSGKHRRPGRAPRSATASRRERGLGMS